MTGGISRLFAAKTLNRAAWVERVKLVMREEQGHISLAAKRLGVSVRTLHRHLSDPAFADVVRAPRGPTLASKARHGS